VKLQQAYISEAVAIGDWQIIGYKGPGESKTVSSTQTTNFRYSDGGSYTEHKAALATGTKVKGWTVENIAKLNDCAGAADNWKVEVEKATGSEGDAKFTSTVATACGDLTPNFSKIGQ